MYPYVTKGPVISGVSRTEAWVAWATAHHQGTGTVCTTDSWTGSPNTDVPALALSPSVPAGSVFRDSNCSRDHKVHLTGLSPGVRYAFSLDKPWVGGTPATGSFTTAPDGVDGRFSFVVYGDTRDNPTLQASTRPDHLAVSAAVLGETDASFLLNTGDLALNILAVSGDDRGYTEFFEVERQLLANRPVFTVIGNHETIDTSDFDAIMNAPGFDGSPHPYYASVEWGQVHVAFVDAFEGPPTSLGFGGRAPAVSPSQLAWLESDLANARESGRIVFLVAHQGPYSHSNDASAHGGSPDVRDRVVPLMLRYGVRAVFAGHDHYYQRGHEGCVDYFVVGGGGAPMYEPDASAPGVAVAVKAPSYAVVTVDGQRATLLAKKTDGTLIDSFELREPDGTECGVPPLRPPETPDAGIDTDAGFPVDAGNSSSPDDAGTSARDAGIAPAADAGEPPPAAVNPLPIERVEGCACGTAVALTPACAVLSALLARRRSRRP